MHSNKDQSKRFIFSPYKIIRYFAILNLSLPNYSFSLIGFSVFVVLFWQFVSGFILAIGFVPEPMYIPASRELDDLENLSIDDMFWIHERGVDYLFLIMYGHLFRKIFTNTINLETEAS